MVAKSVLKTRQKHQIRENKSPISRQVATDGFSAPNALSKSQIWRQVAKPGSSLCFMSYSWNIDSMVSTYDLMI